MEGKAGEQTSWVAGGAEPGMLGCRAGDTCLESQGVPGWRVGGAWAGEPGHLAEQVTKAGQAWRALSTKEQRVLATQESTLSSHLSPAGKGHKCGPCITKLAVHRGRRGEAGVSRGRRGPQRLPTGRPEPCLILLQCQFHSKQILPLGALLSPWH